MFNKYFKELNLGGMAERIYTYLIENGDSSARKLAENLNIPRPSIYDNLKILIKNGLVTERVQDNKKIFLVDDVKNLTRLIKTRIDTLEKEKKLIEDLLPMLAKGISGIEPKIKFYSGVEGVKQVMNDVLWYKDIHTRTMWPISEMIALLGKDFFEEHNRQRIRRNISIRAIWPRNRTVKFKDQPALGTGKGFLREIRLAPHKMSWNMSYWSYADKVGFISSRKEAFGFIVTSKDFSELLRTQFEVIWNLSETIKPEPKYTDEFLKTV